MFGKSIVSISQSGELGVVCHWSGVRLSFSSNSFNWFKQFSSSRRDCRIIVDCKEGGCWSEAQYSPLKVVGNTVTLQMQSLSPEFDWISVSIENVKETSFVDFADSFTLAVNRTIVFVRMRDTNRSIMGIRLGE